MKRAWLGAAAITRVVHLEALEGPMARVGLVLLAHRGPHVGVDGVGALARPRRGDP